MKKLHTAKRVLSFLTCTALSLAFLTYYPKLSGKNDEVHARTLQEIQEEREQRQQEIAALQSQLDAIGSDKADTQAYQDTLQQQTDLIRQNISSLNLEIDTINADIDATEVNITRLEGEMENKQTEIDNKIEDFKERLYSMYVSGNSSLAAVLLGSSSFYDTMVNIEMVNRIAEYDEDLIDQILEDIDALEESKKQLSAEKLTLEMKLDSLDVKKAEKQTELDAYNEKMRQTQDILDSLALEEAMLAGDKNKLQSDLSMLDAEEAEIQAAIQREKEAAQRRYEEEQRRLAAEAAAKAAQQQQQSNNNSGSSSSYTTPVYVVPAPSGGGFIWPAPGFAYISSPFGYRWGRLHGGIDVGDAGIGGGTAVAAKSGTVIAVYNSCTHDSPKSSTCGCNGGYGNYVVISHDGTYSTVYGHLRYATVSVGQYVQAGQQIGAIGCTGFSTGDHLHFEVRVNGVQQNPLSYVSP